MEDISYFYYKDPKQKALSSDIKKYCKNSNIEARGNRYFEKELYKKIDLTEDDINSLLILRFIQTYHVSQIGNPSINDARTSIALYGCIRNGKYDVLKTLLGTQNIKDFLIRRYVGNLNNNNVDVDTLDETLYLMQRYYEYINNKEQPKQKKRC